MSRMILTADVGRLDEVTGFVSAALEDCGAPVKTLMQISIAVEEIYVNIARYAYSPGTGEVEIEAGVQGDPPCAVIRFRDRGTPYNPLLREDPDVSLGVEAREIGGLGIFMVKKSMDEVSYAYEEGQNILTLRKRL